MEYQIKTNLDTLSAAWELLDEIGVSDLLSGGGLSINPGELMRKLLSGKKLQKFIEIVTGGTIENPGELGLDDAVEIITAFFGGMGGALRGLPGIEMRKETVNREQGTVNRERGTVNAEIRSGD